MVDFSRVITDEDRQFLAGNRLELQQTEQGKAIWQNRVKRASEAHVELKSIHTEHDEVDETFPDWPTFRDNFILDWIANRTVVTEEEADAMIEQIVDGALAVIEQSEQTGPTSESGVVVPTLVATEPTADAVVVKRRGRPPGAGKKAAVVKAAAKKGSAKTKRVAAKKKSGGSASAKAQVLIEKYASRDWTRKDIIQKLQSQLDMGAAYASTLYQKFA